MQKIYDFLQRFFCFILSCYILKCNSGLLLHIHLGIALADSHHAATLRHTLCRPNDQCHQTCHRKECAEKLEHDCGCCIRYLCVIFYMRFIQFVRQLIVLDNSCIILLRNPVSGFFLHCDDQFITVDLNFVYFSCIDIF